MVRSKLALSSMIFGFVTIFLIFIYTFLNDYIENYLTYRSGDMFIPIGIIIFIVLILISWLLTTIFGFVSYRLVKKDKKLEGINYSTIGLGLSILVLIVYLLLIFFKF